MRVAASIRLNGGVLFGVRVDGTVSHLEVRDVNGDGRAEIIVASGTGASVGGWLEVLSFDGSTLHEIAHIGGHFFRLRSRGFGKPSVIEGRWKDDVRTSVYEWNGQQFEKAADK